MFKSGVRRPWVHQTPAKLLALDGLLASTIELRREKVAVLWSFYTASIGVDAIVAGFARYNPVWSDGTVGDVAGSAP